jgi:hypothetical protein
MNYALLITFLLVPFGFLAFGVIHQGHHFAFMLAAILCVAWQIKNRFISVFLTYIVAWMIFVFIYSMKFPIPKIVVSSALESTMYIFAGCLLYYLVTASKIDKERFYNVICVAALAQMALALCQLIGFDPILVGLQFAFSPGQAKSLLPGHLTGSLGNNNFLAAYLAISLPFFFRRNWFYAIPFIAFALYKSNTTSAVVPAILASVYFFHEKLTKRELYLGIFGGILVILAYACFQHTPFYENPRWKDWIAAIQQMIISPYPVILGMGPGAGWGKGYPMHNEWLQCFHQFGVIGLSLLAGYVLTVYRKNKMLFAAFIIAAINMFGNYSIHLAPSAFLIILITGLMEREKAYEKAT